MRSRASVVGHNPGRDRLVFSLSPNTFLFSVPLGRWNTLLLRSIGFGGRIVRLYASPKPMQELVSAFREDLRKRYGASACQVEALVKRFLGLWDKVRRVFYGQGKAIIVLPIGDPAYEWSHYVVGNLVVGSLQEINDERQRSLWAEDGFLFPWIATPGTDGETVIRLCAEAMKKSSPGDWSLSCGSAEFLYLLDGCDPIERLERQLWAAMERVGTEISESFAFGDGPVGQGLTNVVREYIDDAGENARIQFYLPRRDHLPLFVVTAGENLSDSAVYQMQHLSLKCGCRFLIFASSEEPESFASDFGGGSVSESVFDLLDYEEAIAHPENVVAAEMEAHHLLVRLEEWCASLRDGPSEGLSVPLEISSAVVKALRSEEDEEG